MGGLIESNQPTSKSYTLGQPFNDATERWYKIVELKNDAYHGVFIIGTYFQNWNSTIYNEIKCRLSYNGLSPAYPSGVGLNRIGYVINGSIVELYAKVGGAHMMNIMVSSKDCKWYNKKYQDYEPEGIIYIE